MYTRWLLTAPAHSSVPAQSKVFLPASDGTLNFFLNEGPIAYCLVVPFAAWLLTRRSGLGRSVTLGGEGLVLLAPLVVVVLVVVVLVVVLVVLVVMVLALLLLRCSWCCRCRCC